jgi:hypothetical protein
MINSYRILVGKLLVKHPLRGLRKRRKDNIKVNFRKVGHEDGRRMEAAQVCVQQRVFVFVVLNLCVLAP